MDLSRVIPWLIVAALAWSGWRWFETRPQSWPPGVIAPDEPRQRELGAEAGPDAGDARDDTGACEIIWVERLRVRYRD